MAGKGIKGLNEDKISRRQLLTIAFVGMFSPAVRILPGASLRIGGAATWLSPIVAAVVAVGLSAVLAWLVKNRREKEGMGELVLRSVGPVAGRVILILMVLWLTLYSGFVLRISAERMLASVFEKGGMTVFIIITLGVSLMAVLGKVKNLARTAEIILLLGVLPAAAVLFSLSDLRIENLLPVNTGDIKGIVLGALPMVDVLCKFTYFTFLAGHCKKQTGIVRQAAIWSCAAAAGFFVIMVTTIGTLSAELAETMENAFFSMIKNITIFGIIERIEAVIVAMWVLTDFVLLSALLMADSKIVTLVLPCTNRKIAAFSIATAVLTVSVVISSSVFELQLFSEWIIPGLNFAFSLIILPVVLLIGKLRRVI